MKRYAESGKIRIGNYTVRRFHEVYIASGRIKAVREGLITSFPAIILSEGISAQGRT
jgi:hypothetical protein